MAVKYTPPPIVGEVVKRWDESSKHHDKFCREYERRERAYKGIMLAASDAAKWRHKYAPKYGFNLIETIVANTVEMGLRFSARPSPHSNMTFEEATAQLEQAEAVEDLLRHEHRVDDMDFKQRPLFLTAAIGGRGVGKCYWNLTEGSVRRQSTEMRDVPDPEGNVAFRVPVITQKEERDVIRDHSTFEVVDPRDFVTHESAKDLQPWKPGGAQYLFHRCWYSFEQLKMWERAGFVENIDLLKESLNFSDEYASRENQVWDINRAKDLVEVLEYWCFKDGRVCRCMVANRMLLIREEEVSPFWHESYPFVISSSMPQPFTTIGMSDVELIEEIQNMVWELGNQTLDNVELINNFIMLIRSDVDDPDAFEHYPGARWPVDDVNQAAALQPPYQLATVALEHQALLKGDLQNVTSAAPFAGGAQSATVDQKTATGASIVMNAAQQRLVAKKYESQRGLRDEADMRLKNCKQFLTQDKLVHIIGPDGAMRFRNIPIADIQGDWVVELEPMGESQMRQEKRAESIQFSQVMMQYAPLAAAAGSPMNVKEIIGWTAKKWDIEDWERFFSQDPATLGAAGGLQAGAGGAPQQQGPPQPNLGITAGSAIDASKPSAAGGITGSPVAMLQRALAMGGGGGGAANG